MFCPSNCSKEGPCLSSPLVSLFLGKDPHPLQARSLPQEAQWAQGRRALLPATPSALVISMGSTPSAPQTVGFLEAETVSGVPAPRLALVLGASLGMKESILPPQAAAPRATGQLSSLPWEAPVHWALPRIVGGPGSLLLANLDGPGFATL